MKRRFCSGFWRARLSIGVDSSGGASVGTTTQTTTCFVLMFWASVQIWLVKRLQNNCAHTTKLVDNSPQIIIHPSSLFHQRFLVDLLFLGPACPLLLVYLSLRVGICLVFHIIDTHDLTQLTAHRATSWRRGFFTFALYRVEPDELANSARASCGAAGLLHKCSDARGLLLLNDNVNINDVHPQAHGVSGT